MDACATENLLGIIDWTMNAEPLRTHPDHEGQPVIILTDSAEGDVKGTEASCGALIVDPADGAREYFGEPIPSALVAQWKSGSLKRVIALAEMLPILVAKQLYGQQNIIFVENEGTKFSCIRILFEEPNSANRLLQITTKELKNQSWAWNARVPSHSNLADPVSRLEHELMSNVFGQKELRYLSLRVYEAHRL